VVHIEKRIARITMRNKFEKIWWRNKIDKVWENKIDEAQAEFTHKLPSPGSGGKHFVQNHKYLFCTNFFWKIFLDSHHGLSKCSNRGHKKPLSEQTMKSNKWTMNEWTMTILINRNSNGNSVWIKSQKSIKNIWKEFRDRNDSDIDRETFKVAGSIRPTLQYYNITSGGEKIEF
jgi:hypothetical protein